MTLSDFLDRRGAGQGLIFRVPRMSLDLRSKFLSPRQRPLPPPISHQQHLGDEGPRIPRKNVVRKQLGTVASVKVMGLLSSEIVEISWISGTCL